ncbi:MAG: geranylgeranyl reductase [Segetibacter sp.]|nr:geranylgeranyl reductase [Segetibacter sp.]
MTERNFDVLIVGAGPSGTATAIKLADSGLKVALLDKATFPRDKTCGDALSVDVINQLAMLSEKLAAAFDGLENKVPSYGVKIFSPDHNHIDVPFIHKNEKSCGFISPRLNFDNLLFQHVKQYPNIQIFENCTVKQVEVIDNRVQLQSNLGTFTGEIIVGADGAHSIVSKFLGDIKVEKKHYSAGLRVYYEGVTSFHDENFIELHFFKDILPGYLWIFPLADNKANVGIGMLSSTVSQKKLNLKEVLQNLLKTHPHLNERFKNAKPLETIKGYGLPLGSKKRNLSGERFLLAGDAAALIDPFSGEGIGNAIRSGRVAAEQIVKCFEQRNFSAAFNKAYDKEIYRRMWNEFKISRTLQNAVRYPVLFNFAIKKARQSKYLQKFFIEALANVEKKKKLLLKPAFYYRMLFK